MNLTF